MLWREICSPQLKFLHRMLQKYVIQNREQCHKFCRSQRDQWCVTFKVHSHMGLRRRPPLLSHPPSYNLSPPFGATHFERRIMCLASSYANACKGGRETGETHEGGRGSSCGKIRADCDILEVWRKEKLDGSLWILYASLYHHLSTVME